MIFISTDDWLLYTFCCFACSLARSRSCQKDIKLLSRTRKRKVHNNYFWGFLSLSILFDSSLLPCLVDDGNTHMDFYLIVGFDGFLHFSLETHKTWCGISISCRSLLCAYVVYTLFLIFLMRILMTSGIAPGIVSILDKDSQHQRWLFYVGWLYSICVWFYLLSKVVQPTDFDYNKETYREVWQWRPTE